MKTLPHLLCTVLFFVLANATLGYSQYKPKLYRVVITNLQNDRSDGILYSVTDSTLTYVPNTSRAIRLLRDGEPKLYSMKADAISQITLRRKGRVIRSVLIGAGIGTAMSVTLATLTEPGDVFSGRNFRLGVALVDVMRWLTIYGAPYTGAQIGGITGLAVRKKFTFRTGSDSFKANRSSIEPFTYAYQLMGEPNTPAIPTPVLP